MNTIKKLNKLSEKLSSRPDIVSYTDYDLLRYVVLKKIKKEIDNIIRYTLKCNRIKRRIKLNKSKK